MAFGTLFVASHATQGPHMGLPQIIQSRAQFGFYGAGIAIFMAVACYVGFGVVYTVLTIVGLSSLFGWFPMVVGVLINAVAAILAVIGHDALQRVSRILFYVTLPLFVVLTVAIISGHGGSVATPAPGGFAWAAFTSQFAVAAAYNIALTPIVSDYTRYLPPTTRPRTLIAAVYAGTGLSAAWLMTLGAWLGDAVRREGCAGVNHRGGRQDDARWRFGARGGIGGDACRVPGIVWVQRGAPNPHGYRHVRSHGDRRSRTAIALGAIVVWSAIAIPFGNGVVGVAGGALSLMLFLLVPWTSINLVDYFIVRKDQYSIDDILDKDGQYGHWSARGIGSYAIGFVSMIPFASLPFFEGPAAKLIGDTDISFLAGLVVSASAYLLLTRLRPARHR